MTDWSTVAIAAISGLAGIGGSVIAGFYNLKALTTTQKRDDAKQLRDVIQELFSELDTVQANCTAQTPLAMAMANGVKPETPIISPNLGRLRAITALYFPELQQAIDSHSERETEATTALRKDLEAGDDSLKVGGRCAMEQLISTSFLCEQLRNSLPAKANEIGRSIRSI